MANVLHPTLRGPDPLPQAFVSILMDAPRSAQALGLFVALTLLWLFNGRRSNLDHKSSVYGLHHGRLHLQVPAAMWMNMGYWRDAGAKPRLSEACRRLLEAVLREAGLVQHSDTRKAPRPTRCLVDVGIGCGDQSICLMSDRPVRPSDTEWWHPSTSAVEFDYYVGITNDAVQARYAGERIDELKRTMQTLHESHDSSIAVACADAAAPASWDDQLRTQIHTARSKSDECWVLALDTAYHFSPSRWPLIHHVHTQLGASFMAFDLCLSPSATLAQKTLLRLLTTLMGAPWANFVTPDEYRQKLVDLSLIHI